jgi:DNA-binding transcriptional LysR family regulator
VAFTPLNALNSFIAVARHRSFAAAARHLGVSTSALSQSVRQLEARLGVTLLKRTSRTVALTDAGQRLLENAGAAVDQALESSRPSDELRSGTLRAVLEQYAAAVPGFFLYFPSRAQVSPAFGPSSMWLVIGLRAPGPVHAAARS